MTRADQNMIRRHVEADASVERVIIKRNGEVHARRWDGNRDLWIFVGWDTDVLQRAKDEAMFRAERQNFERID